GGGGGGGAAAGGGGGGRVPEPGAPAGQDAQAHALLGALLRRGLADVGRRSPGDRHVGDAGLLGLAGRLGPRAGGGLLLLERECLGRHPGSYMNPMTFMRNLPSSVMASGDHGGAPTPFISAPPPPPRRRSAPPAPSPRP